MLALSGGKVTRSVVAQRVRPVGVVAVLRHQPAEAVEAVPLVPDSASRRHCRAAGARRCIDRKVARPKIPAAGTSRAVRSARQIGAPPAEPAELIAPAAQPVHARSAAGIHRALAVDAWDRRAAGRLTRPPLRSWLLPCARATANQVQLFSQPESENTHSYQR